MINNIIQTLMKEINKECFDSLLDLNFPIKMNKDRQARGLLTFSHSKKEIKVELLELTMAVEWNLKEMRNCLAHELIHVYEIQILKQIPDHASNFIKEMNRINQNPKYSVSIQANVKLRPAG